MLKETSRIQLPIDTIKKQKKIKQQFWVYLSIKLCTLWIF